MGYVQEISFCFGWFQAKSNEKIFEKNMKPPQFGATLDSFLTNMKKQVFSQKIWLVTFRHYALLTACKQISKNQWTLFEKH